MLIAMNLWLAAAAAIGLVWLMRFVFMGMMLRRREFLGSSSYGPVPGAASQPAGTPVLLIDGVVGAPRISVLVAAKDEEDNIESCVTSLLDQDYPDYEVIVIDDRSQDRTPEILRNLKKQVEQGPDPPLRPPTSRPSTFDLPKGRLRIVTVGRLPEGWSGKNNAMHVGVGVSSGEWLVFTDADCRQTSRRTLSVAMREVLSHEIDFLSIIPVLETKSAWERVIQPACAFLLIMWYLPHRVNDPARKTAYANGAFMMIRRSCYEAIGGHEQVRSQVNEDVHMARQAKRMGFKLWVAENDDLYRTRMYSTPSQAWRGWSRIFYGCLGSLRRLWISVLMILAYTIMPWASLAVALVGLALSGADSELPWSAAVGGWLGVLLLQHLALCRYYGMIRIGRIWSLAHLPGAVVTLGMLLNAMLKVIGATGTTWRGTFYHASQTAGGSPVAGTKRTGGLGPGGGPQGNRNITQSSRSPDAAYRMTQGVVPASSDNAAGPHD